MLEYYYNYLEKIKEQIRKNKETAKNREKSDNI